MTLGLILSLLDHLWQSTLFAGGAGLLTLLFRANGAGIRFWLWFAASLKFLLPFAALAALGEWLARFFPAALPRALLAIQPAAETWSAPARLVVRPEQGAGLMPLLLGVWLLGLGVVLGLRLVRWARLRTIMAEAQDLPFPGPVRIKASSSLLEPGLVGIVSPVVLLPQGLMARLSDAERDSILAHELGHLRRRDNATAAIHMAVEMLFWFWPPVWLIGGRLIAERERACDEAVLASGHDPEVYAGGILKVCKFCIQSPLACASGASGADLAGRVRQIMTGNEARALTPGKRLLLAGSAALALGLPVMAGFPLAVEVRKQVAVVRSEVAASLSRKVASVEEQVGIVPVHVRATRLPRLKMVQVAAAIPVLPEQPQASPALAQEQAAHVPASVVEPASALLKDAAIALDPRGAGDPEAVTCRAAQPLPASRLPGPVVCKANRQWAELRTRHEQVSPDGRDVIVMNAAERFRTVNLPGCALLARTQGGATVGSGQPSNVCF